MRNRKSALIAGVCTMASVFWLAGCGPKEIENEYVKIKWFDGGDIGISNLVQEDTHIKELRQKRDVLYEYRKWEPEVDIETGEILFDSPFKD